MPTSPISNPVPPAAAHYATLLEQKYPGYLDGTDSTKTLADLYVEYMRKHPSADPKKVYDTVVIRLDLIGKLPGVIAGQIKTTATVIGKVGIAGGVGVAKASGDIAGGLNLGTLFLRAGEVLLGLVLIGVAVAHLTGTDNAISRAAKTAGKVAMF